MSETRFSGPFHSRTGFGCADGFAFALLDTAQFGVTGQAVSDTRGLVAIDEFAQILDYDQPATPGAPRFRGGLAVGIDHFEVPPGFGGDGFDPGSFRVRDGDAVAGGTTLADSDDIVTGVNQNPGRFIHLSFEVDFAADLLSLSLVDGAKTIDVFSKLDISALALDAFNSRLAFGTRSGDAAAAYDVDNIEFEFVAAAAAVPVPGSFGLAAGGLALVTLIRQRRRPIPDHRGSRIR